MPPSRDILLDTGPLVAVLDRTDPDHQVCVDLWHDVADRCITTEAVLAEATTLVGRVGASALPLELLLAARIPLVALEHAGFEHALRLMRRYGLLPMDYADATLVVVGDAIGSGKVFTLDRKGFQAYRRGTGEAFEIFPEV